MTAPTSHLSPLASAPSFASAAVVRPVSQDETFELEEGVEVAAGFEDAAEADFELEEWMGIEAEQRSARQGDVVDQMLRALGIED